MKNIKQFQNTVCHEKKLKDHIDRLIQSNQETSDKLNVFFSGALSSFLTTIMALMLDETIIWKTLLIKVPIVLVTFLVLWFVIAKWLSPVIVAFCEQRKITTKTKQPDQQIVDYFNSSIVLSSLEIKDAVAIVVDPNQDVDCRKINAILVISEYIKCINFIIKNVEAKHIRFSSEEKTKNQTQYINEYCATFVFETLYKAGKDLVSDSNDLKRVARSALIVSDLKDTISRFRDYRKKLDSNLFVYGNEKSI